MNLNRHQIIAIGVFLTLVVLAIVWRNNQKSTDLISQIQNRNSVLSEEEALKKLAFEKIEKSTKGIWDKELSINKYDDSKKAVLGTWWAHDQWEWFAWKSTQGEWQILVSLDGWDCKEMDAISADYKSFFNNNTYKLPNGEKYCFDHSKKMEENEPEDSNGQKTFIFPDIKDSTFSLQYPSTYTIKKSSETNRRGSFSSYEFQVEGAENNPVLYEVQFFSKDSINNFFKNCTDDVCFMGNYPTIKTFEAQQSALANETSYAQYKYKVMPNQDWLVNSYKCAGDSCIIREYTTFIGAGNTTKVDVWIMTWNASQYKQADDLFAKLVFKQSPK